MFRRPTYRRLMVTVFPLAGKQENDSVGLLIRDRTANPGNDDFLSNLSHKLLNPITSVLGYSDLLGNATLDEIQRGWLETIHTNGGRLADLAEDLAEVTALERGGRQGPEEVFTLGDVVDEVLADPTLRTTFQQTEVGLSPGLPMVKTSRTSLRTILRSLLRNAFNYGPHGSAVTLSARHDKPSDQVVVSVKDQGHRIEETETSLVFAPFFQSRQLAGSSDSSTSLCLYIGKSLVENLGEEIWWESGSDDGAAFHFSLAAAP